MALKPVGVAGAASAVTSGDDIATTTQHHAPSGSECPLLNSNNRGIRGDIRRRHRDDNPAPRALWQ